MKKCFFRLILRVPSFSLNIALVSCGFGGSGN